MLLCQTCFAGIDINDHSKQITEISNACHASEIDVSVNEENNNEHCLGACDCDDLSVTVNSEKSSDFKKIKFSPDLYAYVVPQITLSNRALPTHRISTTLEQASLLPLKHFTVLLI